MSQKSMMQAVKDSLMRRPKVRIALDFATNVIYLLLNTGSCLGCVGKDLILEACYRESITRLALKLGSCVSTYQFSTGKGLNAPRQSVISLVV